MLHSSITCKLTDIIHEVLQRGRIACNDISFSGWFYMREEYITVFPPNLEQLTLLFFSFNFVLWDKLVTESQNKLINSRDGYIKQGKCTFTRRWEWEWVHLAFGAFGLPPISGNCGRCGRKGGQPTQSAIAQRDEWKRFRVSEIAFRDVSATVVKYSWQPDGETCRWLNYLWFFYVIIEYNNKATVACTKVADWSARIFFKSGYEQGICESLQLLLNFIALFLCIIDKDRESEFYLININLRSKYHYWPFEKLLLTFWIIYWKVFYRASYKTKIAIDLTDNLAVYEIYEL